MENRANGELCKQLAAPMGAQLLQAGTSSSPGSRLPAKTPRSPPRMAGSSPPSSLEALDHGCVFDVGLFITRTSASQGIRPWSGHPETAFKIRTTEFRSIKTSNKPKAYGSFSKVHHLYPISCSNCFKPTTEVSSAQEPQSPYLTSKPEIFVPTCSWRQGSHLLLR